MADIPGGDGPGPGSVHDHMLAEVGKGRQLGWDEATKHLAKMIADKDGRIANQIETIKQLQTDNDALRARVCELEANNEEVSE